MPRLRLLPLLLPLLLTHPLQAYAEETIIEPPCQATISFFSVGTLHIHFSQDFSRCGFDVFRSTPEGELLYYTYQSGFATDTELQCALKEGEYRLIVTLPSDTDHAQITREYLFEIPDPDMDVDFSFDSSELHIYFNTDETLNSETALLSDAENQDRVLLSSASYTLPRRHFTPGDLNHDGNVNAADASILLAAAAQSGLDHETLSAMQAAEADISNDMQYNAADASLLLAYSSVLGLGKYSGSILEYVENIKQTETDRME